DREEKLLWSGMPDPRRYALRKSWLLFLFGIIFFLWVSASLTPTGTLFFIVMTAFALSPVWHYMRGMRTTYAVTDQRVVIDIAGTMPRRISVPLNQIPFIDMRVRGDGSGDLFFKNLGDSEAVQRIGFMAIPDVRRVEQLLRRAVDASQRSDSQAQGGRA